MEEYTKPIVPPWASISWRITQMSALHHECLAHSALPSLRESGNLTENVLHFAKL